MCSRGVMVLVPDSLPQAYKLYEKTEDCLPARLEDRRQSSVSLGRWNCMEDSLPARLFGRQKTSLPAPLIGRRKTAPARLEDGRQSFIFAFGRHGPATTFALPHRQSIGHLPESRTCRIQLLDPPPKHTHTRREPRSFAREASSLTNYFSKSYTHGLVHSTLYASLHRPSPL